MGAMMRILISAPCSKPEVTGASIGRAFVSLGHEVFMFDHRLFKNLTGIQGAVKSLFAISKWFKPDFTLIIRGEIFTGFPYEEFHSITQSPIALWHFDFNSQVLPNDLVELVKAVDWTLLINYPWVTVLQHQKVNAFWLPQAADEEVFHPPSNFKPQHKTQLGFIGGFKEPRDKLISLLRKDFSVQIWGEHWNKCKDHQDIWQGPAYLGKFNEACHSADIIINTTVYQDWPIYERTVSQRVYMALASKAFMLTDDVPGLTTIFQQNEIATYNQNNIIEQINKFLGSSALRETFAYLGRLRVLKDHTYKHRAKEILRIVQQ